MRARESIRDPLQATTSKPNEELVKSRIDSVLLCLLLASVPGWAQNQTPNQSPNQAPAPAAPAATTPPTTAQTATPAASAPPPPPKVSSTVNIGTGLSIEPIYWYTKAAAPVLRGGAADFNVEPGNLTYPTQPSRSIGGRISVPVSKNATLRVSYFQTKNSGFTTAPKNLAIFGEAITSGDQLGTRYRIENYKLSYDYLTYFWTRGKSEMRLKTLYEIQRVSVANEVDDYPVNAAGVQQPPNAAKGNTALFYPTFGLGLEYTLSSHFRLEARASGFALPHRSDIGDVEAAIAFRVSHFEVLGGGRFYHFKTSPQAAQYVSESLYGPFLSLRYYWSKR
jgi:hypothetical protein